MHLHASFKDINDKQYILHVGNVDESAYQDIELGTPAFTITYEGEDNIKSSMATFTLLSPDYQFQIYSSTAQATPVTLQQPDGTMVWCGYVTPNLYNQSYENELEQIDVECIDALSTLQYFQWEHKEIATFPQVIATILKKCKQYTRFHISTNTTRKGETRNIFHDCSFSQANFYNEEGETTYKNVLESIAQYMTCTCVAWGDEVFFIDYNAIKQGNNKYDTYDINGNYIGQTEHKHHVEIENSIYAENGATLSLGNTYNKASVKATHNVVENILPEILEDKLMVDRFGNEWFTETTLNINKDVYRVRNQYFKHKYYQCHWYSLDGSKIEDIENDYVGMNDQFVINNIGATLLKNDTTNTKNITNGEIEDYVDVEKENKAELNKYLLLAIHNKWNGKPLFTMKYNDILHTYITNNSKLVLKGNVIFNDVNAVDFSNYFKLPALPDYEREDDEILLSQLFLPLKIKLGELYYNAETKQWQTEECVAKIPLYADEELRMLDYIVWGYKHFINKELHIKNTITHLDNLGDAEGYAITLPTSCNTLQNLEITFMNYTTSVGGREIEYVFISDFEANIFRHQSFTSANPFSPNYVDETESINNTTDTIYSNVIDEDFVEEMEEVEWRLNTDNGKANAYSSVFVAEGANTIPLDKTYNNATGQELRQEEQYIYNAVQQHNQPYCVVNLTLENIFTPYTTATDRMLEGRTFVVEGMQIDVEYNKAELTLKEKR